MPCVHEAMTPGHVLDQVDGGQQLVALAVGLHHRVLDAVVDHLAEVAGAHRAGVHEAGARHLLAGLVVRRRRLERVEDRLHLGDVVLGAADHQRVAVLQAPDAAGDAGVDVADALLAQHHVVHLVVGELRVPAVDDDVARAEQLAELLDRRPGRLAGRAPSPRPRAGPPAPRPAPARLSTSRLPGVAVEADHLVTGAAQPLGHVAAHLAQPDQPQLHDVVPSQRSRIRCSSCPCPSRVPRSAPARPAVSAGQAHRHDQVAVAARPLGRLAAGRRRRPAR